MIILQIKTQKKKYILLEIRKNNMSGKFYILNTKMTSSVYIRMMQLLNVLTSSYSYDRKNCILVEHNNLDTISYNKNIDTFLICGEELSKGYVITYIKIRFKLKSKDIIVIDIPHYKDFENIMKEYGFQDDIMKLLQVNYAADCDFVNSICHDEYCRDLCNEFYYTFVKPLYPDLTKPKIKIFEKMDGFLHIKNSVYKTISDKIFEHRFFKEPIILDFRIRRNFSAGFGGLSIYGNSIINIPRRKLNLYQDKKIDFNVYDRYLNFLDRSKYIFGLYYNDENNTCYVIKRANNDLKKDFSYKIDNRQYSYMDYINVPNWLYNTPADKLDIKRIIRLENVDIRALAIKKIGITKLIQHGKIKDSWENYPENEWWAKSEYKLIDMHSIVPPIKTISVNTGRILRTTHLNYAPYLCMKNQTTGEYHLEGVSPECRDLYDALKMRYKGLNLPSYEIQNIK